MLIFNLTNYNTGNPSLACETIKNTGLTQLNEN